MVFSAYDKTKPTNPASTPVVMSADSAREAEKKMMVDPTNSSRIASQRLTEILNKMSVKSLHRIVVHLNDTHLGR